MTNIVERLRKLSAETTLMQSIPVQEAARYIEFLESSWDRCRSECEEHEQLASVKKERDELVAALEKINNVSLGHPYAGVTCGELARAAIAKLGADKTGERKGYEMIDKELLELAAKAAGFKICSYQHGKANCYGLDGKHNFHWNPLTDDGDALRLAVKLELTLGIPFDHTIAMVWTNDISNFIGNAEKEGGIYAATRRAIVRAAAAIGKNMK